MITLLISLKACKLSLNVNKTNQFFFHPSSCGIRILLEGKVIKMEKCIKYLGKQMDSRRNWKCQIQHISEKNRRCIVRDTF